MDRAGVRRVRSCWAAVVLLAVCSSLAASASAPAGASGPPPPALLGVYYGNQGWAMNDVKALEKWQAKRHAVVELFTDWNGSRKTLDNLFKQQLPNIWANANVPLVTWEPFTSPATPDDIEFRIARGDYDGYIRNWGERMAGFLAGGDGILGTGDDRRVYIRLAHEPNGDWYPWGAARGGNDPVDYVRMWQRVHGLVAQAGVGPAQVQWVWAVNGDDVGGHQAEAFYPGHGFVDWVAVDGYNWGASQPWSTWKTPSDVLGPMVSRVRALAALKPLAITETASTSSTAVGASVGSKSAWITELYAWAPANGVRMLVWFNTDKETDWASFGGSAGDESFRSGRTTYKAYAAYRSAVGSSDYTGADTGNARLLSQDQFEGR